MTCIAALEHQGSVWMGWDSCVTGPADEAGTVSHDKVIQLGHMLIGFAGDLGAATVAAYAIGAPREDVGDPREYLATCLVPEVRKVLKDADLEGALDMLVALAGRVWFANTDGVVYRPRCGFGAIGNGAPYAIGALYALHGIEPRQRVEIALKAAGDSCAGVGPPYMIRRVGSPP